MISKRIIKQLAVGCLLIEAVMACDELADLARREPSRQKLTVSPSNAKQLSEEAAKRIEARRKAAAEIWKKPSGDAPGIVRRLRTKDPTDKYNPWAATNDNRMAMLAKAQAIGEKDDKDSILKLTSVE